MSWALLVVGFLFLWLTINSHRPFYWPATAALVSFFAGWLVSELPVHHLTFQLLVTGGLVAGGALDDWPGFVGLGLAGLSWFGLVQHLRLAGRTADLVEDALREGLGGDYREQVLPELRRRFDGRIPWARLAGVIPWLPRYLERHRDIPYARAGGRELHLDVYRHRDRPTRCPTLLYIHGGGWVIGNKREQGLVTLHHLAARGWVCVTINYRLSPRATFPEHLLDVKQAIRWVREHGSEYGADPSCLVLVGGSAGGHLASLAALTPNDPEYQPGFPEVDTTVQGCVSFYGVYDFTDRAGYWRHGRFRNLLEMVIMKRRFTESTAEFRKASPLYRLGPEAPPFFVLHGDNDTMVPVESAREFRDAFRARAAAPLAYAEFPGAHHAFEIIPSVRSTQVIHGVERFCAFVYSRHREAEHTREAAQ